MPFKQCIFLTLEIPATVDDTGHRLIYLRSMQSRHIL